MTAPDDQTRYSPAPIPVVPGSVPAQPPQPPVPPPHGSPYAPHPVPLQPPRKSMSAGAIIGIVLGSMLLVVCMLGVIVAALSGNSRASHNDGAPASAPSPVATAAVSAAPATAAPTTSSSTTTPASVVLPADQTYSGRGAKIVRLKLSADYVHIAKITHSGGGNFAIWSVDANGGNVDLLVNEIGTYSGVRPLDFEGTPAALKIEASGAWKVTVQVAQKAPSWTGNSSGKGSAVLRITPGTADGLTPVTFTHSGSGNFAVWAYSDGRDLLVNEIGKYSGETLLPNGTVVVVIEADGSWTFKNS